MILTQRYLDILVFFLVIFCNKTAMTCQECGGSMALVFEDDIKHVISPEFNDYGEIVDYVGSFPAPGRTGVTENGYFEIQCKNGCRNTFHPDQFFGVVNRVEQIYLIRSGVRKDRVTGQHSLFDDFI